MFTFVILKIFLKKINLFQFFSKRLKEFRSKVGKGAEIFVIWWMKGGKVNRYAALQGGRGGSKVCQKVHYVTVEHSHIKA